MSKIKTLEEMILELANKPEPSKQEVNVRTCKMCQQPKQRIFAGKFNFKDSRWVDETGKQWMGRTCPDCNVIRARSTMAKGRVKNVKTENPSSSIDSSPPMEHSSKEEN